MKQYYVSYLNIYNDVATVWVTAEFEQDAIKKVKDDNWDVVLIIDCIMIKS